MLSSSDHHTLLAIARDAITAAAKDLPLPELELNTFPDALRETRVCFVTLHIRGELRGCIGGLEARQPLALDAQEHAVGAATSDPRFPPISSVEVAHLRIEISVLTTPELISHNTPQELLAALRPRVDGVILRSGYRRATFLPQVWEKVSGPETFMEMLGEKMGAHQNAWRSADVEVLRYQVEMFEEKES
jgi:hypothetical protein